MHSNITAARIEDVPEKVATQGVAAVMNRKYAAKNTDSVRNSVKLRLMAIMATDVAVSMAKLSTQDSSGIKPNCPACGVSEGRHLQIIHAEIAAKMQATPRERSMLVKRVSFFVI